MAKVRFCKSCNNVLVGNEKTCSKCGRKISRPFYKKWWIYACVVIVACAAVMLSFPDLALNTIAQKFDNKTKIDKTEETAIVQVFNKNKFELIGDITTHNDGSCYYINGIIKNNSSKLCPFVQISFNLYDKDGNQIGVAFACINNFEPGGTWKFTAQGYVPNTYEIKSYKLVSVDVY